MSTEDDLKSLDIGIVVGSVKGLRAGSALKLVFEQSTIGYFEIKVIAEFHVEENKESIEKKDSKNKGSFKNKHKVETKDVRYYFTDGFPPGRYRLKELAFGSVELKCDYQSHTVYSLSKESDDFFEIKAGEKYYIGDIDVSGMYTEIKKQGEFFNTVNVDHANVKVLFREYFPKLNFTELVANPGQITEGNHQGEGSVYRGVIDCSDVPSAMSDPMMLMKPKFNPSMLK